MAEDFLIDGLTPDDEVDDIGPELEYAGREAMFGFSNMWPMPPFSWLADLGMPHCCPNCASLELLVAIDHRQQRNFFCRDCAMCWHYEFGQFRRVDRELCPGCDLATTACFEHFERPAVPTVRLLAMISSAR